MIESSSDVPEAPTFRPTSEEWRDPLAYISQIVRRQAEAVGMAKVVPPSSWAPVFQLEPRRVRFPCQLLMVHHLYNRESSAAEKQFWERYNAWRGATGGKLRKQPTFAGQEIDIYRLYRVVSKRGGYQKVTDDKAWRDVVSALQITDKNGNGPSTLRQIYQRLLLPFEDHENGQALGGAGLLAAAMEAERSENPDDDAEDVNDVIGDDEAAEILEAMLGLAPAALAAEPQKKKRRANWKVSGIKIPHDIFTMVCEKCKGGHFEDKIILCDRCDKGWHMFCLSPPLDAVPDGEWVCPSCVVRDFEAGASRPAGSYTLEEFQRMAASFERQWFGSDECAAAADVSRREAEFWRIVEHGEDPAEVLHGVNLDTTVVGSGFLCVSKKEEREQEANAGAADANGLSQEFEVAKSLWNLNNLPQGGQEHLNLVRFLDGSVSGVTAPQLHIGMLFSADCWRLTPHLFYSLAYLHTGAPRRWYSVPAYGAAAFEAALREAVPGAFATQPDLLFDPQTMLPPSLLASRGVPIVQVTQEPGTFVLTFPNAYHAAVDLGHNVLESLDIAPADWLRFGAMSVSRLRSFRRKGIVSQDRLLIYAARACAMAAAGVPSMRDALSPRACIWIANELRRATEEERVMRAKLWSEGLVRSRRIEQTVGMDPGDASDAECAICRLSLHLSAVECDCCEGRRTCLHHAANLCECPMRRRRLAWRYTMHDLDSLQSHVMAGTSPDIAAGIEAEEAEVVSVVRNALSAHAGFASVDGGNRAQMRSGAAGTNERAGKLTGAASRRPGARVGSQLRDASRTPDAAFAADGAAVLGVGIDGVKSEEADILNSLANAVTEPEDSSAEANASSKRKREDMARDSRDASTDHEAHKQQQRRQQLPIVQTYSNGFVQGPVRPFQMVDVYPEDQEAVSVWLAALEERCKAWQERAQAVLHQGGGALAVELPDLVEEAEQFAWGGARPEDVAAVAELQPRLAAAEEYMSAVNAALKGKPLLESVEALLNADPKPLVNPPGLDQLAEAVLSANDWRGKYAALAAPDADPVDVKLLETAVVEASRLPITLTEARSLRERLNTARKVGAAIRDCLPTAREVGRRKRDEANALPVARLQELQQLAASVRVDIPEAANLAAAVERIEAWQARAEAVLEVRSPMGELQELLQEADSLPAALSELDQIASLVDKAEHWIQQMQNLIRGRAPLKKMRDLLHAGLRLPVEVPEVEQLRQDIRRREWEEAARRGASTKGTLHALTEALNQAAEMGVEDSALALTLQARVDAALEWETRARAFCARFEVEGGCPEAQRPTVEELEGIVSAGNETGVKMERLATLSQQLSAAQKWTIRAQQCLAVVDQLEGAAKHSSERGGEPGQAASSGAGTTADIQEQHATSAAHEDPMQAESNGDRVVGGQVDDEDAANDDEGDEDEGPDSRRSSRGNIKHKPKGPGRPRLKQMHNVAPPQFDTLATLMQEYDEQLMVRLEDAPRLRALLSTAQAWLKEAQPVLEQEFVVDEQLPLLKELISKGRATGIAIEQVDILEANAEALLWAQHVRKLLNTLPELPPGQLPPLESLPLGARTLPASTHEGHNGHAAEGKSGDDDDQGSQLFPGLYTSGVPPPDPDLPREEFSGPFPTSPYDQRPSLPGLVKLLEEGHILPCDEELFARFRRHVEAGLDFDRAARSVLAVNKDGGPAALVAVQSLRRLIARGERLGLGIPALPRLHEVLRAHEKWEIRVRDLMATAGARPAFAELRVFQQTARLSPVTSNLRRHIDAAVEAVEDWQERLRRSIAKRNTGMRLDRCFDLLNQTIDTGIDQFERRLEMEKKLVGAADQGQRQVPGPAGPEDPRERYCLCQQPYHVDTAMVNCDICGEWMHMRCVGLTQTQARTLRKFTCPVCAAVRNHLDPLELALGKLRRTRRPERAELGAMLAEVKRLPVMVDEETALERLLTKFDRWATATNRAVEVHEASRKKDAGEGVLPLSDVMLHQLCRSALAMEIDATDHAERILHLLRCNRWRMRVNAVLDAGGGNGGGSSAAAGAPGGKASAEAVAKLLIEADRLEVEAKNDVEGARLLEAAEATRAWQDAVRTCIANLKSAGGASNPAFGTACETAHALIAQAHSLPIRVDREVEKLAEYAKPYCLCRRAYDEQIPMLECDKCGEWYHFECVGLKPPGAAKQEGDEEAPDNYGCPLCCMRASTKYPFFHKLPLSSMEALKEAAANMPPPSAAAVPHPAAAAAMAAAMYPQAWPFAAAMAPRSLPMAGLPMGMPNPQAMAQMIEAYHEQQQKQQQQQGGGASAGMAPGLTPAMFAFPGMMQAATPVPPMAAAQPQQQHKQGTLGKAEGNGEKEQDSNAP